MEAVAHGRKALGFDVNPLAVFVTRAKTTPLASTDRAAMDCWMKIAPLRQLPAPNSSDKRAAKLPEELRRPLAAALSTLDNLDNSRQRAFARCALLRTSQWALESRDVFPTEGALQTKLDEVIKAMLSGMDALVEMAREHGVAKTKLPRRRRLVTAPAKEAAADSRVGDLMGKVRLAITSPPYPGVHVLYHRWQIRGRRETAAPYWIARHRDGYGPRHYTMGGRSSEGERRYFVRLAESFEALRPLFAPGALVVQLVAFSRCDEQLPLFLRAMEKAGYGLASPFKDLGAELVRRVPNRRWYVRGRELDAGREYLFFHTPVA